MTPAVINFSEISPSKQYFVRKRSSISRPKYSTSMAGKDILKLDSIDDYIVTELVSGIEYTIDCLYDPLMPSPIVIPRVRSKVEGGISVAAKVVNDPKIILETANLIVKKNICGITCVQLIKNSVGNFYIEVNPRCGAGLGFSIASGADLPRVLMRGEQFLDMSKISWGDYVRINGRYCHA